MIKEREMPLKSYTLIHGDANLSDAQREELSKWAEQIRARIQPNIIKLLTDLRIFADLRYQISNLRKIKNPSSDISEEGFLLKFYKLQSFRNNLCYFRNHTS